MNNYVISLIDAQNRREHIKREFDKHNIRFEFYDAIKPSIELDKLIEYHIPNLKKSALTQGEKACFMSHFLLWKKCLEQNLEYITIYEDDIILGSNADKFLGNDDWLKERITTNKFILRLETFLMSSKMENSQIPAYLNRKINILKEPHYGTAGYIISSDCIKEVISIIKNIPDSELDAIDQILFNYLLTQNTISIYQLSPGVCVQELQINKKSSLLSSDLEADRKKRYNEQNKKGIRYRIMKIITKPKRMLNKYLAKKYIVKFE
ncbi:hypothetical protein B0186_09660 [Canicola haemoglobinophilus]|uniref:Galactosyl transferase Lic2B n=1 Tax=Canicola haemoglobinophilus TaxID=733 RepID=A0A1V4AZ44_9PAST|nr:glycosyltransferase family 25 protein [Canicola haemoglobinophilus]OOR98204.1 hypothetical protein B0186_09660 [Canicola haemoglobinophilus]STO55543.1 galactosyl transferase Lic2B [Canicola haemoglobinophilus]STO58965.1 galactosyl transferase Lic2B [Canicola haemoglobinophilus]STO67870.1 galactosyl transferase Lic2B [Canicola haemoglobinophilus]